MMDACNHDLLLFCSETVIHILIIPLMIGFATIRLSAEDMFSEVLWKTDSRFRIIKMHK